MYSSFINFFIHNISIFGVFFFFFESYKWNDEFDFNLFPSSFSVNILAYKKCDRHHSKNLNLSNDNRYRGEQKYSKLKTGTNTSFLSSCICPFVFKCRIEQIDEWWTKTKKKCTVHRHKRANTHDQSKWTSQPPIGTICCGKHFLSPSFDEN